jgi:UDP-glucose 4-epimerase
MATRNDFWTAVDARDSAQAFEKAVSRPYEGSHVLFVNDSHNRAGVESRALASLFFPDAELAAPLEGTASLVSIAKAREMLGFEPEYSASRFF